LSCDTSKRRLLTGLVAAAAANQAAAAPPVTRVDLTKIAPGRQIVVYWDFRPHFVRRLTREQVTARDETRVKNPEWVVVEAVCTHAGCLPALGQGTGMGGWLCPCHGSEFDLSGRVIQGPAARNLPVPPHSFVGAGQLVIGQD
jgi:ubiquinol-cytochrome c reductase iron-sulfur subunit